MSIKVIVAFSSLLLSTGISRLLEGEDEIEVTDVLEVGAGYEDRVRGLKPDVVLVDFLTLYNGFKETVTDAGTRFILLDTTCGEYNITSAISEKGVSGVLQVNATPASLKEAVRTIAGGGLWFEKKSHEASYRRYVSESL